VHHGLSANADAWVAHAQATAERLGVTFESERVDVPRDSGLGIEATARERRYAALDAMRERHGVAALWIAQHADDQAETVLLQLLRGAGIAGLAAMAPRYRPDGASVERVRPLLRLLRAQLERCGAARARVDRRRIECRRAMRAMRCARRAAGARRAFPGFRDVGRAAQHAAAAQRLLDDLAELDFAGAARDDGRALSRDALIAFDDTRGANLLRYWMRTLGLPGASAGRLANMMRQLRDAHDACAAGRSRGPVPAALSRCGVLGAGRQRGAAGRRHRHAASRLVARGTATRWHLPAWRGTFVRSPRRRRAATGGAGGAAAQRGRPAQQRRRAAAYVAGRPRTTLKNLFQERGVPAWQRRRACCWTAVSGSCRGSASIMATGWRRPLAPHRMAARPADRLARGSLAAVIARRFSPLGTAPERLPNGGAACQAGLYRVRSDVCSARF
jgi:tRNA(Ile)-lysidine synthase